MPQETSAFSSLHLVCGRWLLLTAFHMCFPHLYASWAFVKGPTHLDGHPLPSKAWLATSTNWLGGGSFSNQPKPFKYLWLRKVEFYPYVIYTHTHTCMHTPFHRPRIRARGSWCLRNLIVGAAETQQAVLLSGNNYFRIIWFRKRHQRPRISLLESNWNGSALDLVGDSFLLQLLQINDGMSWRRRYRITPSHDFYI